MPENAKDPDLSGSSGDNNSMESLYAIQSGSALVFIVLCLRRSFSTNRSGIEIFDDTFWNIPALIYETWKGSTRIDSSLRSEVSPLKSTIISARQTRHHDAAILIVAFSPHLRGCHFHPVDKRWYSVEAVDEHQIEGFFRPWSPVAGTDKHPVRYCFADVRSQKNLGKVVDHAINKWKPAFERSLLDVTPDNKKQLICEDGKTRVDALVIRDATKDDDPDWNKGSECPTDNASTGYNYDPAFKNSQRHRLDFCHLDPDDIKGTEAQAVRAMMHEFGHAIGLQHEHQRHDRDDYLDFRCENLIGYKEAKD